LGIDDVVAELVLGHALKGLKASYNVYGFAAEKRRALEIWANDLLNVSADRTTDDLDADAIFAALKSGREMPPELAKALAEFAKTNA
jgi:hypothetical protein